MAMNKPRFETHKGADHRFYARLKARNGEILFASEGFTNEKSAEDAIFRLIGIMQANYYELKFRSDE